jgi:hypothetical protein
MKKELKERLKKTKKLSFSLKKKKRKKKRVELNPNHLEDFEALLNQAITPPASIISNISPGSFLSI